MIMKNTILLLALALFSIGFTSCSRGYGCPYSMGAELRPLEEEKSPNINDIKIITTPEHDNDTELIAD